MIDQSRTRWDIAKDYPVAAGVTKINEGSALVLSMENGVGKVKNSSGSNSEIFVGVAYSQMDTPSVGMDVRTYTVPAGRVINLPNIPTAITAIGIKSGAAAFTLAGTAPAAAGAVQYTTGTSLTFHADDVGKEVTVTYKHELTINQQRWMAGDGIPGVGNPVAASGSVGVIQNGTVYTDQFDAAADWGAANVTDIKAGASGQFIRGGTGATVTGYVVAVPAVASAYLGIHFRA